MSRILFIGNGFNLISDGGASWNGLLNGLAGDAKTEHEEMVRKEKPFTLWFEEIKSSNSTDLKKTVVKSLYKGLSPNQHHKAIMALDFKHILTTNYDYCLEDALEGKWKQNKPAPESHYSLFRRRSLGDRRHVWHIHGELESEGSIMLGHGQYSGYIQKIRNFLTNGVDTKVKARKGKPYLSKYTRKKTKGKGDVENWVDLFLEHEVHILGFSFDYTENHLWNLLMEKKRLKEAGVPVGAVVFHRCSDKKQSVADEAKLSILAALGARVVDHAASTYIESYANCIKTL